MRNAGLIAFSVTTLVLVPAAIHHLMAGQEQIAKLGSPDTGTITIGKATVTASLDQYVLDPGGTLTVHLAASEATGKALEVGVLVLGSNGSEGDRVQTPPNGVAFKTVRIDLADGAGTADLRVPLKGAQQSSWRPFGNYTVLVGTPRAVAHLDKLRKRSGLLGDPDEGIPSLNRAGESFMNLYAGYGYPDGQKDDSAYGEGAMARLEAHVRPASTAMAMELPATAPVGKPFTVKIHVTNPSRRAMKGLEVTLAEHLGFDFDTEGSSKVWVTPEPIVIDLAPKETRDVSFEVVANEVGVVGLRTQAQCRYSEEKNACNDVQTLQIGTFDAIELVPAETPAPVVGKR